MKEQEGKEHSEKLRIAAIRFSGEDQDLGLSILIDRNGARMWPGGPQKEDGIIYTTTRGRIEEVVSRLEEAEIGYEVNLDLPASLTFDQAKKLWEFDGWKRAEEVGVQ